MGKTVGRSKKFILVRGFTILEILVVLAVLAILIGMAVPRIKGMQDQGSITRAKSELRTLQTAVESFKVTRGSYPLHKGWMRKTTPKIVNERDWTDPWKNRYHYFQPGGDPQYYFIYSQGPSVPTDTKITRCDLRLDTPTGVPYEPAGCLGAFVTNAPISSMTPQKT